MIRVLLNIETVKERQGALVGSSGSILNRGRPHCRRGLQNVRVWVWVHPRAPFFDHLRLVQFEIIKKRFLSAKPLHLDDPSRKGNFPSRDDQFTRTRSEIVARFKVWGPPSKKIMYVVCICSRPLLATKRLPPPHPTNLKPLRLLLATLTRRNNTLLWKPQLKLRFSLLQWGFWQKPRAFQDFWFVGPGWIYIKVGQAKNELTVRA